MLADFLNVCRATPLDFTRFRASRDSCRPSAGSAVDATDKAEAYLASSRCRDIMDFVVILRERTCPIDVPY